MEKLPKLKIGDVLENTYHTFMRTTDEHFSELDSYADFQKACAILDRLQNDGILSFEDRETFDNAFCFYFDGLIQWLNEVL